MRQAVRAEQGGVEGKELNDEEKKLLMGGRRHLLSRLKSLTDQQVDKLINIRMCPGVP